MGSSRTLVHAGLRTPARPGWRAGVVEALAGVATRPSLWLLGALGFMVRGGVLLLTLPVLVLPSPVAVRLLIGENLTSFGFSPALYAALAVGGGLLLLLVMGGLLAAAATEVAAFARLTGNEPAAGRRSAVIGVFAIQLLGLAALVAAALPLVTGAIEVSHAELLRPSLGGPLYERVLAQLGGPLYLLVVVLVVVEATTALATRRLLAGAFGQQRAVGSPLAAVIVGIGRPIRRPLTTLGTAIVGWAIWLALIVPALWLLGVAWQSVRGALLNTHPPAGGEEIGALVAVLAMSAAWLFCLAAAGLAAAIRAALWTVEELR